MWPSSQPLERHWKKWPAGFAGGFDYDYHYDHDLH
jgi:hypothetical protein